MMRRLSCGGTRRTPSTSAAARPAIPTRPTSKQEWTLQAAADPARVVRDPDSKIRAAYIRLIGYSSGTGFVLTVIIDPQDSSDVTAWKTRGADLRNYLERKDTADD